MKADPVDCGRSGLRCGAVECGAVNCGAAQFTLQASDDPSPPNPTQHCEHATKRASVVLPCANVGVLAQVHRTHPGDF